jgi:hypothetical protein
MNLQSTQTVHQNKEDNASQIKGSVKSLSSRLDRMEGRTSGCENN